MSAAPLPNSVLVLAQQAAKQGAVALDLSPPQQQALLLALVAEVSALRAELHRAQKIILILLGILIGTQGGEKILALIGG